MTDTTHDREVFSFHPDQSPCHGFDEVLACYRKIVPHLRLAGASSTYRFIFSVAETETYSDSFVSVFPVGPTSFAPIVEAAVDIVERSRGQYHVLVIIADGQVLLFAASSTPHVSSIKQALSTGGMICCEGHQKRRHKRRGSQPTREENHRLNCDGKVYVHRSCLCPNM